MTIEMPWDYEDVQRYLGLPGDPIAPSTIRKWVREKKIPYGRLPNGAIRFLRSEVDAWLVRGGCPRKTTPPAEAYRGTKCGGDQSDGPQSAA